MGWESELFDLFDDLEAHADSLWQSDREAELADRAHSEYAQVTLASRLMASVDARVSLDLPHLGRLSGTLRRVGEDWCLLAVPSQGQRVQEWIVALRHVVAVHGASPRSVPELAWSPWHRLGMRSALRRLADAGTECLVDLVDGTRHEGVVRRIGADFTEVRVVGGSDVLVASAAVVAVRSREG